MSGGFGSVSRRAIQLLRPLLAPLVLLATTGLSLPSALGATVLTWVVIGGQIGTNNRFFLDLPGVLLVDNILHATRMGRRTYG